MKLRPEDVTQIIKAHVIKCGYTFHSINFKVSSHVEGIGGRGETVTQFDGIEVETTRGDDP